MIGQQGGANPKQIRKKKTHTASFCNSTTKKGPVPGHFRKPSNGFSFGASPAVQSKNPSTRPGMPQPVPLSANRKGSNQLSQRFPKDYGYSGLGACYEAPKFKKSRGMVQSFSCLQQEEVMMSQFGQDQFYEKRSNRRETKDYIQFVKIEEGKTTPTTNSEDDNVKLLSGVSIQINGRPLLPKKNQTPREESEAKSERSLTSDLESQGIAPTNEERTYQEEKRAMLFFGAASVVGPKKLNFPVPTM